MIEGVSWALIAGLMLGLYAVPAKFTKDFEEENTWGLFFMLTMFFVPILATLMLLGGVEGIATIYGQPDVGAILLPMVLASVLWGIGVMMWGKAIHHIGVSLGFSIFIGTVILVGSIIPMFVDGPPKTPALISILIGLSFILVGLIANGRAGILREKSEDASTPEGEAAEETGKSVTTGILIAVVGGLLATGFSFANAFGRPALHAASQAEGNAEWVTAIAVMFPIFLSGGVIMAGYFAWQLTSKNAWGKFKTPALFSNFGLIMVMAVFHYAASAVFAFAAFSLGDAGNTVGYAIFNAASVMTAIVSGVITGEWAKASGKAKQSLYMGLGLMVVGISIIAYGNTLA